MIGRHTRASAAKFIAKRLRRLALTALVVLGLLTMAGFGYAINSARGANSSADFPAFYTAASIVKAGDASRLYDAGFQLETQRAVTHNPRRERLQPYLNPPVYAAVLAPLGMLALPTAYVTLVLVETGLLAFSAALIWRLTAGVSTARRYLFVFGVVASPVTLQGIFETQTTLLVLLAILGSLVIAGGGADRRGVAWPGRPVVAGALLSVICLKPQVALPFLVVLAITRQWRIVSGFIAGAAVITLLSAWLVGPQGLLDEARLIQDTVDPAATYQQNWTGFVYSFFPAQERVLQPVGMVLLGVGALALVWRVRRLRDPIAIYGLAALAGIIVNSHVHPHDLALLAVSALLILSLGRSWLALSWYYWSQVSRVLAATGISLTIFPLAGSALLIIWWLRNMDEGGQVSRPLDRRPTTDTPTHSPGVTRRAMSSRRRGLSSGQNGTPYPGDSRPAGRPGTARQTRLAVRPGEC